MHKLFGIALDDSELNPASLLCLMMISMNSGGLSAGKLCEICCFDKALVSRTFKELERSGYIVRNPKDKELQRGYRMVLTQKGVQTADLAQARIHEFWSVTTDNISESELRAFYDTSLKLSLNMRKFVKRAAKQKNNNE